MSVNTMNFEQAATLLNAIQNQVTGKTNIVATDVSEFVSCAQKTLQAGYDPVLNSISQVVGKTIFSIRPYYRKFRGLMMDEVKWGYIIRKLSISDKDWSANDEFNLVDGQSVDMWEVNKPNVLQMNYYGAITYARYYTVFKDQLDAAFRGPNEFGEFMSMVTQNCLDLIEQAHENMARLAIGNFVTGKYTANNGVIHLLTEYNADTGESLTNKTVYEPANFPNFVKWLYSRIADLTNMMTQRTQMFQIQVTGKEITRHTPLSMQKVYLFSKFLNEINARVKGDVYHDNYLELSDVEAVPYWQDPTDRMKFNIKPVYLATDGTLTTPSNAVELDNVLGVIFDEEAIGQTIHNYWTSTTAMNSRGGYFNIWYHWTEKYVNDFTEKGIILLLD